MGVGRTIGAYIAALRWWLVLMVIGGLAGVAGLLDQLKDSGALPFALPAFVTTPPAWLWWLVGYVAIAIGGFGAFYKVHNQITRWEKKQAIADDLQVEWSYGLHQLLNANILSNEDFARYDFSGKELVWKDRVRKIMERHGCSAQELSHVFELHEVRPIQTANAMITDAYVSHALNLVSERLHRIRDIIRDHEIKPSTPGNGAPLSTEAGS